MALDATVGGATSNSYLTRAEALALVADRLYATTWSALSDEDKDKTLIMATRLIDRLCWLGAHSSSTQALAFPRSGLKISGRAINTTTIPAPIINATLEYAILIASGDPSAPNDPLDQGLKRVKAGPVEVEFQNLLEAQAKMLPSVIANWIPPNWLCPDRKNTAEFRVL